MRLHHPEHDIIVYYSLSEDRDIILKALHDFQVEAVDIGRPGLLMSTSANGYSNYNSLEFNIKTSFKWLAILGAMSTRLEDIMFIDADIVCFPHCRLTHSRKSGTITIYLYKTKVTAFFRSTLVLDSWLEVL
jgi:hypothetical protein